MGWVSDLFKGKKQDTGAISAYGQEQARLAHEAATETQRRAEEDRKRALAGYDPVEELLTGLYQAPESIDDLTAAMMLEQGRQGIEAGTQATQRQLQQAFEARGMTGSGAALGTIASAGMTGSGQVANLQSQIGIQQALQRRTDLLNAIGAGSGVAGAKAGILGNTIAAVPGLGDPSTYAGYVKAVSTPSQPGILGGLIQGGLTALGTSMGGPVGGMIGSTIGGAFNPGGANPAAGMFIPPASQAYNPYASSATALPSGPLTQPLQLQGPAALARR